MAAEHYDVILTDIRMPDLDGRALYRRSSGAGPARPARRLRDRRHARLALREFVDESGRPVIEKPFLPSEVRRVVEEMTVD